MHPTILWPVLLLLSYLAGSFSSGLWVGRLASGVDVRSEGSRRTGATNVQRVLGTRLGIVVAVLDIVKGALPVLVVRALTGDPYLAALAGFLAVVGHVWPVFAGFGGGRGVATTAGAVAALSPVAFVVCLLLMVGVVATTRLVSLGSIIAAAASGPITAILLGHGPGSDAAILVAVLAGGLVILKHADNLARLRRGTERRLGESRKEL